MSRTQWVLAAFLIALVGCSEKQDEQAADNDAVAEELRALREEVGQLREEAAEPDPIDPAEPSEGETTDADEPKPPAYEPPADHLEPFAVSFGFENEAEVAHFFRWNHEWKFSEVRAENLTWENNTFFECRYRLNGDFEVDLDGYMTRSYSNSKRPHLVVAGHEIRLLPHARHSNIACNVRREGTLLIYTVNGSEPTTVTLTDEQLGPATVRLRVHNRHARIRRYTLTAESADRVVEDE